LATKSEGRVRFVSHCRSDLPIDASVDQTEARSEKRPVAFGVAVLRLLTGLLPVRILIGARLDRQRRSGFIDRRPGGRFSIWNEFTSSLLRAE
jgi:hypothetical protein